MIFEKQPEQSAHWYSASGESAHDADLRKARKEKLYPSVTSIQQVMASPQLEQWKINEAILSALTLPRIAGETDQDFAKRILVDSKSHSKKSAEIGNALHQYAEDYIADKMPVAVSGYELSCYSLRDWIDQNIDKSTAICEEAIVSKEYGYAGRVDLQCRLLDGRHAIIDWKSSGVKPGAKPVFYDKWAGQLAAYAEGKDRVLISVIIGTNPKNQMVSAYEWTPEEIAENWSIFKHCLAIWQLERGYDPRID